MKDLYETALLSLLKVGEAIVVEKINEEKIMLINNGLEIEKADIVSMSKEEQDMLHNGTRIQFNIGSDLGSATNNLPC